MEIGFYVRKKIDEWEGPIERLSVARDLARTYGPDIEIWHGAPHPKGYFEGKVIPKIEKENLGASQ